MTESPLVYLHNDIVMIVALQWLQDLIDLVRSHQLLYWLDTWRLNEPDVAIGSRKIDLGLLGHTIVFSLHLPLFLILELLIVKLSVSSLVSS